MDDFTPAELQQFVAELHLSPNGASSMGSRYARESGYVSKFIGFFDPFQYEADLRALAGQLPLNGNLLAVIYPKNRYSIRFYSFRGCGDSIVPFVRKDIQPLGPSHPGYWGIRDADTALEYQQNPGARQKFEKALVLTAAAALYRVLHTRSGGLYFMEKGWSYACRLSAGLDLFTSADAGPPAMPDMEQPRLSGPGTFYVCIDAFAGSVASGTFYNSFVEGRLAFPDLMGFLQSADRIMDSAAFPQAYHRRRGFVEPVLAGDGVEIAERRRNLKRRRQPKDLALLRGRHGTFWIDVLYRQGGSWQGVAKWFPPMKGRSLELTFRSALELVLAMDEVLQRQKDMGNRQGDTA